MKAPNLSPAQAAMLGRAVKTNGGGLNAYSENRSTVDALVRRGFIEAKSGSPSRIVHTPEGLAAWRALEGSAAA